ncbi:hypothetical protein J8L85_00400 [Maribacter sp. MMG018]|uniref:hypothetical protein n=1 Tax=Maribacter sp. MMG018 TaxID=2822688 RepID=UPI001B35AC05|nr:hypothetical protein [Maribacter sp. MMG018]MBQ4912875.1 hypothetical protein [Maribacter sp. MMG018]
MNWSPVVTNRIFLGVLVLCTAIVSGQESLKSKVREIQLSTPATVASSKLTFQQDMKVISPSYLQFSVTETDDKGRAEKREYAFGLSDIDQRSVRSFTYKDRILVEIRTKGRQKLIQRSLDGGNKVDYVGDLTLLARNAANGRSLKEALEEAIPVAEEYDKNALNLHTYTDHLDWLENNIESVSLPKERIGQELMADKDRPAYVRFERMRGTREESAVFNLSLLNPASLRYEMSGSELFLEIWTKNNVNAIKYFEGDSPKGFGDKLVIYAKNMPHAKKIHQVLEGVVPLAEVHFGRYSPDIGTIPKAVDYINPRIGNVVMPEGNTRQKLVLEDNRAILERNETRVKEAINNEYIFDINDIDPRKLILDNDKTRFILELHVKNGQPFIRHIENGRALNFRKYVRLFFNTIDDALFSKEALQTILDKNENKLQVKQNIDRIPFYQGLEALGNTIGKVDKDDISYHQEVKLFNREMSGITFTKGIAEPKRTRELVYEFSTRDLNRNQMNIGVSGNRIWVELFTKNKQKLVKLYENGQVQNYQYRIDIEATDAVNAKDIIALFRKIEDLDTE